MHATSIQAVDDMVQLVDIHESAILRNLKEKYSRDQVYVSFVNFNGQTSIGSILIAVNPYKTLDIYNSQMVRKYNGKTIGELPPHIFAISDDAYYRMVRNRMNQCLIIRYLGGF